jgi:nucleotide-binding universal stress UspA family protein
VAVDLSDRSDQVIRAALRVRNGSRAEVLLVHVVVDLEELLGTYVFDRPVPQLQAEVELEGATRLRRLFLDYLTGGTGDRELLLRGVPWAEILGASVRHRTDLIVLGTHTEDRPETFVLGSTVQRVIRQAPCPVLLVPPE